MTAVFIHYINSVHVIVLHVAPSSRPVLKNVSKCLKIWANLVDADLALYTNMVAAGSSKMTISSIVVRHGSHEIRK
jgi:hypothetical protein